MRCVSGQREGKIAGERGSCKGGRAAVEESGARGGYRLRGHNGFQSIELKMMKDWGSRTGSINITDQG